MSNSDFNKQFDKGIYIAAFIALYNLVIKRRIYEIVETVFNAPDGGSGNRRIRRPDDRVTHDAKYAMDMETRRVADRAANRAEEAVAAVGAMQDGWNRIVADNRYLESRLDAADALIADLTQLVLALAERA